MIEISGDVTSRERIGDHIVIRYGARSEWIHLSSLEGMDEASALARIDEQMVARRAARRVRDDDTELQDAIDREDLEAAGAQVIGRVVLVPTIALWSSIAELAARLPVRSVAVVGSARKVYVKTGGGWVEYVPAG